MHGKYLRGLLARLVLHDAGTSGFDAQRHRRRAIHDDIDPQQLNRGKWRVPAEQGRHQHGQYRADVGGKLKAHEIHDIVVHHATLLHRANNGGEVIVGQHHGGRLPGHCGAGDAHGHADMGGFQGRRIVDAVASHGGDVAIGAQGMDDFDLMRWRNAGKHCDAIDAPRQLRLVHGIELGTAHHLALQPQLVADGRRRQLVVAGDHLDLDTGTPAVGDGVLRLRPRRIHQAGQPQESPALSPRHQVARRVEIVRRE